MTEFVTTTANKPALKQLVLQLPAVLAGRAEDPQGIAEGFHLRIGFKLLELIKFNFDELGRGNQGADGTQWPPLTKAYLAYGRRFDTGEKTALRKQAGVTKGHRHGPGDTVGLLTMQELKEWRRIFARHVAMYMHRGNTEKDAKSHAAAVAWMIMKERGAKTKLEVYGNRTVQILVGTGRGRNSLTPGTLSEDGPKAKYSLPGGNGGSEQHFENSPDQIVVGTNVKYMGYHHNAKSPKRRRRLWPEHLPTEWWRQILGIAISGLVRIGELFQGGKGI
jgi:hypothetical protein